MITIRRATTSEEFAVAKEMFREYQRAIDVDLCFQSFAQELEMLPQMYSPAGGGALFLASRSTDGEAVGCVALRTLPSNGEGARRTTCEMKRLYVRPAARGHGLGRQLVDALVAEARRMGYSRMRLDTLSTMTEARALYASVGFIEIPPYNEHPVEGTHFMELAIS